MVGVLILIDQDVAKAGTKARFGFRKLLQDLHSLHNQIVKVHGICLLQALFIHRINIGDDGLKLIGGMA